MAAAVTVRSADVAVSDSRAGKPAARPELAGVNKGARKANRRRAGKASAQVARAARAAARGQRGGSPSEPPVPPGPPEGLWGRGVWQREFLDHLARAGIDNRCKTQPPAAPGGRYSKAHFYIDLDADSVTCPAGEEVTIRRNKSGDGIAYFESACATCPLRSDCTTAAQGRTIQVGRHEPPGRSPHPGQRPEMA